MHCTTIMIRLLNCSYSYILFYFFVTILFCVEFLLVSYFLPFFIFISCLLCSLEPSLPKKFKKKLDFSRSYCQFLIRSEPLDQTLKKKKKILKFLKTVHLKTRREKLFCMYFHTCLILIYVHIWYKCLYVLKVHTVGGTVEMKCKTNSYWEYCTWR